MVLLLDQMFLHKSMGKKDRAKLADLICSMALEVLAEDDDAELKDIYNRHSGGDFDAEADQDGAAFKGMMENRTASRASQGGHAPQAGRRAREQRQAAEADAKQGISEFPCDTQPGQSHH